MPERRTAVPVNLRNRSFLKEIDFTPAELRFLLKLSADLKTAKYSGTEVKRLEGKNIGLIFEKTSTRTRCSFEVASYDQGANVTYLDPVSSQMGHKESVADTARVLGRYYDGLEYRGKAQADVETLAEYSGVPVWNGLTDEWHPTQMLADYLTMYETSGGKDFRDISYAFMGDLRFNMGLSHLVTAALLGADIRMVGPAELAPPADVLKIAQDIAATTGAKITVSDDPAAVEGVDFIHTDVWVSMGESKDVWNDRVSLLKPYQVNSDLMAASGNADVKFMHCLPAFHDIGTVVGREMMEATDMPNGLEVTHEVFESPASVAFDQAENRLHTIKAIMVATLGS
jgi:ornithine carbamoyltransferase